MSAAGAPRLVCLLPVRNAAGVLPEWLDEAGRFADAVIALDDGSTDDTGRVLAANPLVAQVLTNRRRVGYLGWHDGVNRNRLLAATAELCPEWVFFLDADERMDPTDAEALRHFVTTEAIASCAYGFRVYRMLADERYDPVYQWAYRLFRFHPDRRLPHRRLDIVPVPGDISALMQTTLRIKHYGEVGTEGRQARIDKLRAADPEGNFLRWYNNLPPLSPGPHPHWTPRDGETPVLATSMELAAEDVDLEAELAALDLEGPVLTVAVLAEPGDEVEAMSTLGTLAAKDLPVPTQLLVVTTQPGTHRSLGAVDGLEVVTAPPGSSPAVILNVALDAAGGDYVVFFAVPTPIDASVLGAIVAAHERGHALVGGTLVNLTATPAGWAGFLLDQPIVSNEPQLLPTTAYSSFAREPLLGVGGFEEGTAPEAMAAHRLLRSGFSAVVLPELRVGRRHLSSARELLRHRFRLGRAIVSADERSSPRAAAVLGWATVRHAAAGSRHLATVADVAASRLAVTALTWAGAGATWMGAAREALSPRRRPGQDSS